MKKIVLCPNMSRDEGLECTRQVRDMLERAGCQVVLSPIYGDLENFPPTLLIAGGAEPRRADSLRMAEALIQAGSEAELLVGKDMIHTYPLDFADYPEAAEAFSEIAAYIRIKLGLED